MRAGRQALDQIGESIFSTISQMAANKGAVNLSQGFPDFDGPDWIRDFAKDAIDEGFNQYCPSNGITELRSAISDYYKEFYDLNYDLNKEITCMTGATECIFTSILALVEPGDEVVLFEPYYDSYLASVRIAGGIPKFVTLNAPTFKFSESLLEDAITKKTKLVILNSPHNPTGKVFSKEELETIQRIAVKHDLYILSDEVYEFLTFDDTKHIPISSLEGMKERTLCISSSSKTFGLTGWKIGWICAPEQITSQIRKVRQFSTFCGVHPLQVAISKALPKLSDYLPGFRSTFEEKRNRFIKKFDKWGLKYYKPQGTYFINLFIDDLTCKNDVDYCMELIDTYKVATIPPSSFYSVSEDGKTYLRFCFAKRKRTIKQALENLSPAFYKGESE